MRLMAYGDLASSRSGPADYWAGQRTTGGPIGAAPASARIADPLERDLELIRGSRQFGALGDQ